MPELRPRIADLETVVCRLANLIAKADGHVAHQETKALQAIQERFRSEPPAAAYPASLRPAVGANSTATPAPLPGNAKQPPRNETHRLCAGSGGRLADRPGTGILARRRDRRPDRRS